MRGIIVLERPFQWKLIGEPESYVEGDDCVRDSTGRQSSV